MGAKQLELAVYYDGECPFCSRYVLMLRLHRAAAVRLVDLREAPEERQALSAAGFDVDQGMVVDLAGRRTRGAQAVATLASLSTPSDFFNCVNGE
jgi:predicted DCC family thiol-disulfide oxidoreductase YuxK